MAEGTSHIVSFFREFMKRVVVLEETSVRAEQSLSSFHQSLEQLRRLTLQQASPLVAKILVGAATPEADAYLTAGCRVLEADSLSAATLDRDLQRLRSHSRQAGELVAELGELLGGAEAALTAGFDRRPASSANASGRASLVNTGSEGHRQTPPQQEARTAVPAHIESRMLTASSAGGAAKGEGAAAGVALEGEGGREQDEQEGEEEEGEERSSYFQISSFGEATAGGGGGQLRPALVVEMDRVTLMSALLGMLQQDVAMQEKVVQALSLATPGSQLEAYATLWRLRPFVDERVVDKALSWL